MISVFVGFQSVASLKAREKDVEVLRLFVRHIDITQHLLVYCHVILNCCSSSVTLLYMQNSKSFCPVCLINLLKFWQKDVRIMQSVVVMASSMLLLSLDHIANKYNNTYHNTIEMNPVDVKSNRYIISSKEIYDKDPKFKIDDIVRISKHKNIFEKSYVPNWSEEVFVIKTIKNTVPWPYVISDLNEEEFVGTLYKNVLQKTNQKEFRAEKVIKRKDAMIILLTVELIKKKYI